MAAAAAGGRAARGRRRQYAAVQAAGHRALGHTRRVADSQRAAAAHVLLRRAPIHLRAGRAEALAHLRARRGAHGLRARCRRRARVRLRHARRPVQANARAGGGIGRGRALALSGSAAGAAALRVAARARAAAHGGRPCLAPPPAAGHRRLWPLRRPAVLPTVRRPRRGRRPGGGGKRGGRGVPRPRLDRPRPALAPLLLLVAPARALEHGQPRGQRAQPRQLKRHFARRAGQRGRPARQPLDDGALAVLGGRQRRRRGRRRGRGDARAGGGGHCRGRTRAAPVAAATHGLVGGADGALGVLRVRGRHGCARCVPAARCKWAYRARRHSHRAPAALVVHAQGGGVVRGGPSAGPRARHHPRRRTVAVRPLPAPDFGGARARLR
mmetsp:Transcript_39310/g.97110  ORF Transcript_39310/g.97110 Transcript_39310/m.97110 type:complete len:383 (+) Transcript_39310:794-1942(+)